MVAITDVPELEFHTVIKICKTIRKSKQFSKLTSLYAVSSTSILITPVNKQIKLEFMKNLNRDTKIIK